MRSSPMMTGNRRRRWWSGSTRISATTGCGRRRGRWRRGRRSSRSTWIETSRSDRACSTRVAASLAAAIEAAGGSPPIGIGKPELPLFLAAVERLGCEPHQAAMVGDSTASDIEGGRKAGMFTIWLKPEHRASLPASVDLLRPRPRGLAPPLARRKVLTAIDNSGRRGPYDRIFPSRPILLRELERSRRAPARSHGT